MNERDNVVKEKAIFQTDVTPPSKNEVVSKTVSRECVCLKILSVNNQETDA